MLNFLVPICTTFSLTNTPVASEIKNMRIPEGRCIPVLRLPVFDTTPPGVGGRLKPRCARHGNFTPPRISPSCPHRNFMAGQEYHCVLTRSLRNGLSAVSGRVGTARRLIWPSLMGGTPTGGSWRTLQGRLLVRERISVAGCDRAQPGIFQSAERNRKRPPHCVGSERAFYISSFQKFFYFFLGNTFVIRSFTKMNKNAIIRIHLRWKIFVPSTHLVIG